MKAAPKTERKADFARRLDVSRQYIQKLAGTGLPLDANGDVKIEEALAWIKANTGQLAADNDAPSLVLARTRLVVAQAAKAEVELTKIQGSAIDRETAKRAASAYARIQRDTILNFSNRHGPNLAALWGVDPRTVINSLDAALREMLIEMAAQPVPFHAGQE